MQGLNVVIPAYNAAQHIERAVNSALALNVDPANIIVVDDGSTDGTSAVARRLGCNVLHQSNAGASHARRSGILAATQPLLILLDADDALEATGVAESLRLGTQVKDWVAILGSTQARAMGEGAITEMRPWPEGVSVESLLRRGYSPGPPGAFVWRTAALETIHTQKPDMLSPRFAEDYELLIRGAALGTVLTHSQISCLYQTTGGKSSHFPLEDNRTAEDIRMHYAEVLGYHAVRRRDSELRSMALFREAYTRAGSRLLLSRAYYIARAFMSDPRFVLRLVIRRCARLMKAGQRK